MVAVGAGVEGLKAGGNAATGTAGAAKGPYGHLKDHKSVGPDKVYTSSQKRNIMAENVKNNGGVIKDVKTGEMLVKPKVYTKGHKPPRNEAQVDHQVPRKPPTGSGVKPGSNSYSNATVRSRANNIAKSNKVEP